MATKDCPTCTAIEAVLTASRRVPRPVARAVSRTAPVRRLDRNLRKVKRIHTVSEYSKKLSKHLRKERAKATKKNGDFKKGWDMSRVMASAHKCVKKEMRK